MCGISGIISTNNRHDLVRRMTTAIHHRGPDGEGYYEDDVIALGHKRLSIVDLEGGKQPISNETDNLQLICNGEIYNSPELRDLLIRKGHRFKTFTDVEVILHLYEEYGKNCVKHLRGMFAFAIWDRNKRTLFIGKDHLGQKPLFFCNNGDQFLFSSEVKGILAAGTVKTSPNLDALWHYMSLRFIPDHDTLFNGIEKLPAASTLLWKDGKVTIEKYWSPYFRDKLSGNESDIEEGLDQLLLETVRLHMLSDVRVGTFLSGGIDSSLITAMVAKVTGEKFPTFSIGVEEQNFNELPYSRQVTEKYNLEAHEKIVKADLIHLIPSMIHHLDEPSDPFGVGVYLVSQVASQYVKVVLSGDGGDENFAGYDRFAGQQLAEYYSYMPAWFRTQVMKRLIKKIPESFGYKSLQQKMWWMNEMSFFTQGDRYVHSMSFLRFPHEAKMQLFSGQAIETLKDNDSAEKILRFFNSDSVEEVVDRMLYTDLMTRMPDHLLSIVDRMSMAHSLESRPPLMDYKLVEYAASIPAHMKLRGRNLKYILKKVSARYLPHDLIYRKKQGFSFPLGVWMRTDLKVFIRNLFDQSRFVELGIFNKTYMDKLYNEHISGKADHNFRLWILINLELWYRLNFEGETVDSLRQFTDKLMES